MAANEHEREPQESPGYEKRDAHVPSVLLAGVLIMVILMGVSGVGWVLMEVFSRYTEWKQPAVPPLVDPARRRMPPEPRLQVMPNEDLTQMRAAEDAVLNTYGWVDRGAGIARIPITQAMAVTADRGLPSAVTKESSTTLAVDQSGTTQSTTTGQGAGS